MRYLKLFESYSESDIDSICKKLDIRNYTVNGDGTVDVHNNVNIRNRNLWKIPLKFRKVDGDFICYYNQLTSLEGAPTEVGGSFYCTNNQLTNLEGAPSEVGGEFQ
jgi:hypothetical protein